LHTPGVIEASSFTDQIFFKRTCYHIRLITCNYKWN